MAVTDVRGRPGHAEADEPTAALHRLTDWALGRGTPLERLTVEQPTLEDIYLGLTSTVRGAGCILAVRRTGPHAVLAERRGRRPGRSRHDQHPDPPPPSVTRAPRATPQRPDERGSVAMLVHQIRYEQLSFWRNPQSMVFTFVLPIVIIAIFGAVFSGSADEKFFFGLTGMQYYTPTIAAVSVLGACYGQLAIVLAMRRQTGVLKRLHATPLPAWVYFAGLLVHCIVVSVVDVVARHRDRHAVRRVAAHALGGRSW